jgi:6-phosphogluconolactonase (cycloisomerase 2 family)
MAYVGAYTDRGKGIHSFTVDQNDGTLTPGKILTGIVSPSSIYIHPNKKFMYAGNEISNFTGANTSGSVTAISIDPATGDLKILNAISSGGRGPAHVSVDPTGKFVFAANYGSGHVGVLSIKEDGSLDKVVDSKQISGPLGKNPAVDAPPGSFAISGHDAPHVHMVAMDPFGRYVLACRSRYRPHLHLQDGSVLRCLVAQRPGIRPGHRRRWPAPFCFSRHRPLPLRSQ